MLKRVAAALLAGLLSVCAASALGEGVMLGVQVKDTPAPTEQLTAEPTATPFVLVHVCCYRARGLLSGVRRAF